MTKFSPQTPPTKPAIAFDKADRETKALLHWVSASKSTPVSELSPEIARRNYKQSVAKTDIEAPKVASIENIAIAGKAGALALRIYKPERDVTKTPSPAPYPAILFCHGGGCVFGDLDTHDSLCCSLSADCEAIVIAIDYRLSPEHNFPAPIEDGISALTWLMTQITALNIDPKRIALAGDSAGGGMATTVIQECRDLPNFSPCAQLLIYPAVDITAKAASRTELSSAFPIDADTLEWFYSHYFDATWPLHDPRAHPMLYQDFVKVPTLIMTAGLDPLHGEAIAYGQRMESFGVPVHYKNYEGTIHGFMGMGRLLRKVHRTARKDMADFLNEQFSG